MICGGDGKADGPDKGDGKRAAGSAEVMEGRASRIFDQAENRLHAQQALLAVLMGGL